MNKHHEMRELPGDVQRQYINAREVFLALREAEHAAREYQGSMFWREQDGKQYLVRTSRRGAQTGLGARTPETELIHDNFVERKTAAEQRVADLRDRMRKHVRLNRALFVGRVDKTIIDILNAIRDAGLGDNFTVIGTNALYAYEASAGVRIEEEHLATEDLDLLWDNRKRLTLTTREKITGTGLLGILKRIDKSFELRRPTQLYTAINASGYQVDVIRRMGPGSDNEPEDFWAVQARNADWLLSAPKFHSVIVGSNGSMANMVTVDPRAFALFKVWMAQDKDRDPLKKRRDISQAGIVVQLVREYLPQLSFDDIKVFPSEVRGMMPVELKP